MVVVAPALAKLGVPLLTAHMFVFFYGCVSTITPPVALASYVAAGIAKADINRVGWTAFFYGITCYLLPFMFFFGPELMLDGTGATAICDYNEEGDNDWQRSDAGISIESSINNVPLTPCGCQTISTRFLPPVLAW